MGRLLPEDVEPRNLSPLALAFVGDGVYELMVRERLVCQANRPVNELHKQAVAMVRAEAQAAAMDVFFASACKCEPDKQWRIMVPQNLRDYAKIDRDIVITGNNDRAQIWSAEKWAEKTRAELTPANIANILDSLGI